MDLPLEMILELLMLGCCISRSGVVLHPLLQEEDEAHQKFQATALGSLSCVGEWSSLCVCGAHARARGRAGGRVVWRAGGQADGRAGGQVGVGVGVCMCVCEREFSELAILLATTQSKGHYVCVCERMMCV